MEAILIFVLDICSLFVMFSFVALPSSCMLFRALHPSYTLHTHLSKITTSRMHHCSSNVISFIIKMKQQKKEIYYGLDNDIRLGLAC